MNINASIIDQQLSGIIEKNPRWFSDFENDAPKTRSAAFVLLCMAHAMDIQIEDSIELLTEGVHDAGVDGLHIGDVDDGEFLITIFQGKYKVKDLSGEANFPENAVQKMANTVRILFDPARKVELNPRIAPKIEEIRSLIADAYIPRLRIFLCNNGKAWHPDAQHWINALNKDFPGKIDFFHFNHDSIVNILQKPQTIDTTLQLTGKLIVEDMNFMRVLLGRVSVQAIAKLFAEHGDRLLQRNIRRYLGLHNNRVNAAIQKTLQSPEKSDKFYFYNNGITVVCDKFDYNAFQNNDHTIRLHNMQVINGGQTCKTIHDTLYPSPAELFDNPIGQPDQPAYVMIRIYQMAEESADLIRDITYATNSQNPVNLRDLRSNDEIQKQLEAGMQGLGYTYKRQREVNGSGITSISSLTVAEAVLAVWREKPHLAKFKRKEHFGELYNEIFTNVSAAQAIIAVLIFRTAEALRKHPSSKTPPEFLPYASHYIAMLVGRRLLQESTMKLADISHRNFGEVKSLLEKNSTHYHAQAVDNIAQALKYHYGNRSLSLQQLSATFRRGDLLETLARGLVSGSILGFYEFNPV